MKISKRIVVVVVVKAALTAAPVFADELLSGPYTFDSVVAVHAKPAMLGTGWGMTLGGSWDNVINQTVTTGFELNADIPVVPYPTEPKQTVNQVYGGLRLGTFFDSAAVFHGFFNNTLGVGLMGSQTFLINETELAGEVNVTKDIRAFVGAGYRYTYGINNDRGVADANTRGLFFDVGMRYGQIGR